MKTLFMFLLQLLLIGGVFKLVLFMFIPKPLRKLLFRYLPKSISALFRGICSMVIAIKADFESDEEDFDDDDTLPENVISFKSKVK
jgi:hypothetical protein